MLTPLLGFELPGSALANAEGAVLLLLVVPGEMGADELAGDPDLDGVFDQAHLHLLAGESRAHPIGGASEAQVAPGIHLAKDRGVTELRLDSPARPASAKLQANAVNSGGRIRWSPSCESTNQCSSKKVMARSSSEKS